MEYFNIMNQACNNVQVPFDEQKYNDFILYKDLVKEWNEKINLTAITEDEEMIKKHFIDCIKIFNFDYLKGAKKIVDVGTGAGFPGIPIKIIYPEKEMLLLDSLNKRINFLNEVVSNLKMTDIAAKHGRAEELAQNQEYREQYDAAVSRAVANLTVLSELCLPFVKKGGYFIAMKGPSVDVEIEESKKAIAVLGGKVMDIIKVQIEDSDLEHNLVIIKKVSNTPKQYPRKPGTAQKKPLR